MKVALSIEITDEQRNVLAHLHADRRTKKLASRDDVRDFIEGAIASLTEDALPEFKPQEKIDPAEAHYDVGNGTLVKVKRGPDVHRHYIDAWIEALSTEDRKKYDDLKAKGHTDAYVRGFFYIERAKLRNGAPLRDKE